MADLFGHRDNISYNETGSSFNRANSMTRPSGKSIYRQRKEYTETMIKQQHEFQHRVEHLLTVNADGKEISNVENCIDRLKMMDAQGQVWGQDMLLQVKDHKLLLTDVEAEEELDCYPLEHIQDCACVLDSCVYNSILAITVKETRPPRTSIMLFQCEQIAAELMKIKVEKAIKKWSGERQNHDLLRTNLENMLYLQSQASRTDKPPRIPQDKRHGGPMELAHDTSPALLPWQRQEQHPCKAGPGSVDYSIEAEQQLGHQQNCESAWEDPGPQMMQEIDRNTEILNHVLNDIEIFVEKLQETSNSQNDKKKKKKKKKAKKNKIQEKLPPEPEFKDCFQKIKYSFNLLAKLEHSMQQPSASEMIHLIFSTLPVILSSCPWTNLASAVVSPLLIPAAVDLLRRSLNTKELVIWKNFGDAWTLTRAEHPEGQSIPPYKPTFSDGWVLPVPTQRQSSVDSHKAHTGNQNSFSDRAPDPPQLMQAMYEFHARNSKELAVMKGDLLEVLDQRKKWWLARNTVGETGYIPNNILEPMDQKTPNGNNREQVSTGFTDLHPSSTPAEVALWLRTKGFSKITVKSLSILNGRQLLSFSKEELKAVCPEEWTRVFFTLSEVRARLANYPPK
ncbi:epidermal growth factor receptor kinase substrate 8-like protein 3 isoform X2 [Rhineura floridana]|uniref:epidermal growth factor receptor kinase substrate 8-like protein 3 isoform X2 n=1 Tax=Rhineura floridana TaxID=261503 RepID=UPI002AC7EDB6|nr:epidermal growth factor receptor kinase substrate 8-like protein 3 isoform X2 [Rhineura floridana]